MAGVSYTCQKCNKAMDEGNFYTYKNGQKTEMCKKCLTMHIDNFKPDTFLWLLEKMDVPYVPGEWNTLRDKAFNKDPSKMNGMSVFGKYLSKMRLNQWKEKTWADTEKIAAEAEEKKKKWEEEKKSSEEEIRRQFENGEINEAQYKTLMRTETLHEEYQAAPINIDEAIGVDNPFSAKAILEDDDSSFVTDLTEEDKKYLDLKWGRVYKLSEKVELEKKYDEMMNSFDIQDSDTIGTLILICKTYLKMNQAIDMGDMDGFQKLSRVYDSLRKSAKFTAAQNKAQKSDFVDSVGEIITICEKQGFIPRFATDIPQDKVDLTLKDMENYLNKLVTQDLGFGQQIEDALKKLEIQKQMRESEDDLFGDQKEISDNQYEEYYSEIEEQIEQDLKMQEEDE